MATTNISEIKYLVKPDVLSCPDPIVNREVLSTILEFCKKTNILQREFQLDIDSNDIDTDIQNCIDFDISEHCRDLRPVACLSFLIDSTKFIPFKRNLRNTITSYDYVGGAVDNSHAIDDRFKYYWVPNNHTLRIFDMSSSDSKLYVKLSLKPLRTATTIDTDIFEDWSEALVAGAKWKLLKMPGEEWSDRASAQDYKRDWRKYLSQAKQEAMSGGTKVADELIQWKSFIY
ncbi:MAG: hypothetical protein ACYTE8_00440 [Planctomycetota bacterium]|jgi:hypothetical protein